MSTITIRGESPSDYEAIRAVVCAAFGKLQEADLVEAIRTTEGYRRRYSLVAVTDDDILCGHVMLSANEIVGAEATHAVLCLAPLSIAPDYQRRGIGTQLVQQVLKIAKLHNEPAVTVEGDPRYYSRFGFEPGYEHSVIFHLPDWAPKDAGRILFLSDKQFTGQVVYRKAFELVE